MGDFPFKDPSKARYEGPTLFVRGTKSHYVPDDVLPLIGRFFPRFELWDIDCGHWVISEKPELFRQGKFPFTVLGFHAEHASRYEVLARRTISRVISQL